MEYIRIKFSYGQKGQGYQELSDELEDVIRLTDLSGNTTSVSAYTQNIAKTWTGSNKGVYLDTIPKLDSEITVISAQTYTSTTSANTWTKLSYSFNHY